MWKIVKKKNIIKVIENSKVRWLKCYFKIVKVEAEIFKIFKIGKWLWENHKILNLCFMLLVTHLTWKHSITSRIVSFTHTLMVITLIMSNSHWSKCLKHWLVDNSSLYCLGSKSNHINVNEKKSTMKLTYPHVNVLYVSHCHSFSGDYLLHLMM